ncbi:MAG: tRNA epoxyqueuosine(34) reductase QueG [Candidatus Acidiferrales bacterium]
MPAETPTLPTLAISRAAKSAIVHHVGVSTVDRTRWIVEQARALGFDLCGVAPAEAFEELRRPPEWLARGHAGEMNYLHDSRRGAPARVLEGARSIIVAALNYRTQQPYSTEVPISQAGETPRGWISRYAWGDDYHDVLQQKLDALVAAMHDEFLDPFDARAYVDTGPIVERVAAHHAGLGWLAKNTMLINEELGSWLFLGVIITTLDLEPTVRENESLPADLCGQCRLCIDACPTDAITEPYLLDARRCISYLTIELRGAIPEELRPGMGRMVFGCDICQDVCPWNRNAPVTTVAEFLPRRFSTVQSGVTTEDPATIKSEDDILFSPSLESLASISETGFREIFRGSPIKRAKWRGLVRNACIALGNSALAPRTEQHTRIVKMLEHLSESPDAVIAEHARWALARVVRAD